MSETTQPSLDALRIVPGIKNAFFSHSGRYPWSNFPRHAFVAMARTHPSVIQEVRQLHYTSLGVNTDDLNFAGVVTGPLSLGEGGLNSASNLDKDGAMVQGARIAIDSFDAFTRWILGGKRLVQPTRRSCYQLIEPRLDLTRLLSSRGEASWKRGYMIELPTWPGAKIKRDVDTEGLAVDMLMLSGFIFYCEPVETALGMGIRIYGWGKTEPRAGLDSHWSPITFREWGGEAAMRYGEEESLKPSYAGFIEYDRFTVREAKALGALADGTRFNMALARILCINVLSALLSAPDVMAVNRPKRRKGSRRSSTVGGVRGVKRLVLSDDASRMVMTRWKREENETRQSSTRTVGLHHVDAHYWRIWVNNPLAHEHVLATRQKPIKGGVKTQYRVKRWRGGKGFSRGSGPLSPSKSMIVTGIDDG